MKGGGAMSQFDYLVPLIAIMVGLALTDLAASFHRLVRARRRVRWHWMPLAAAILLILLTLELWWGVPNLTIPDRPYTIGMFLPIMVQLIILYLLASAALPDEVPAEGLDLGAYYFDNRGYFWLLLAGLVGLFAAHRIGFIWVIRGSDQALRALPGTIPNLVLIAILVSLAITTRRWWHALWLALMPLFYLANLFGRALS
jgi:hypothetical protein